MARHWQPGLVDMLCGRRYTEAVTLLNGLMSGASGSDKGWLLLQRSVVLHEQSYALESAALADALAAAKLLEPEGDRIVAVLHGMVCALALEDTDTLNTLEGQADDTVRANRKDCAPWIGRLRYQKGMVRCLKADKMTRDGNHSEARALRLDALDMFRRTLDWLSENEGPYGKHDQQCESRTTTTMKADVLSLLGRHEEARAMVEPVMSKLRDSPDSAAVYQYWLGRIAVMEGRLPDGLRHLEVAHQKNAEFTRTNTYLRNRIIEALAQVYAVTGDREAARRMVDPLIVDAARVRNTGLVYRLQWLLSNVVGRNSDEEDSCSVRGSGRSCDGVISGASGC